MHRITRIYGPSGALPQHPISQPVADECANDERRSDQDGQEPARRSPVGILGGSSATLTLGLLQAWPSSESNPQFSEQIGTPTPTDAAARRCGLQARSTPIGISYSPRV